MRKHNGIILKTYYPKKTKITLLDDLLGKIEGIPPDTRLGIGTHIEYHPIEKGKVYHLNDIEIIDVPLYLGKENILFLHHVLEICYFAVPFGSNVPEIFNMLHMLYNRCQPCEYQYQIAFVFKLLATLGLYPYERRFQEPYFYELAMESIDTIALKAIDLKMQQELYEWIYANISEHPLIPHFKTINFLTRDRMS